MEMASTANEHAPWVDELLSKEEEENAINEAKRTKYCARQARLLMDSRDELKAEMTRPWSADEYLVYLKWRAEHILGWKYKTAGIKMPGLQIDHENAELIKWLCLYFTNDPAFEEIVLGTDGSGKVYKGDLQKGLLLYGAYGVGKTALMELCASNQRCSYKVYQVPKIARDYQNHGAAVIDALSTRTVVVPEHGYFYHREMGKCFNDLLREEGTKNNYGNIANVMSQIFFELSENRIEPWKIHATSNFQLTAIGAAYGEHVKDRCYQFFNLIEVKGRSRRRD
jgi:hypothetical protein